MAHVVASVFNTVADAENAVRDLLHAQFTDDDIGVVVHDRALGPSIADDLGREYRSGSNPPDSLLTSRTDVFETIPGGFANEVKNTQAPPDTLGWFSDQLDQHKIMLIVNAGNRLQDAEKILHNDGGLSFEDNQPQMATPTTMTPSPPPTTPTPTPNMLQQEELHMPVIEEEVYVEKTTHQVGEVSIASDTTMQTVDIPTSVTHEELHIERRKLDHPMRPDEYQGSTIEPGVIRMPIVEEEVRVVKSPIIREELVVTRMPVTEQQTLHETVMHAEPDVQTTGNVQMEGTTSEEPGQERPAA